jgi:hypothetical protein
MGKRHPNYRLVKIHRNYSVEQIASLCVKHKNTVRAWLKGGLQSIDESRPVLVTGDPWRPFSRRDAWLERDHARPAISTASNAARPNCLTMALSRSSRFRTGLATSRRFVRRAAPRCIGAPAIIA